MIVYYSLYKYRIISNDDTFESHIYISYRYICISKIKYLYYRHQYLQLISRKIMKINYLFKYKRFVKHVTT